MPRMVRTVHTDTRSQSLSTGGISGSIEALCEPNKQLERTVIRQRVRAAGAALPWCACDA